jgi:glycosyltransferase involved in cell wall biosynthesis/SAM-dependent methyltransferase
MNTQDLYGKYYYLTSCGIPYDQQDKWYSFFGKIADEIIRKINPKTVLDAGCAYGYLVAALRDRGVEAYGIDISEYAITQVRDDIKPFCSVGSVLDPLKQNYDLIVCIEVIEHLHANESIAAIENLCKYTNDFLFSSTPTDFKEATHFNVQPTNYWANLFSASGFYRDVDFDASFIIDHAIRFVKYKEPVHKVISDYERVFYQKYLENKQLREELIAARAELSQKFENSGSTQSPGQLTKQLELHLALLDKEHLKQINARVKTLTASLKDKDAQIQLLNELLKSKEYNFSHSLDEINKKDSIITKLASESHSFASELNRIKNLKAVKLLWKYYKFRDHFLFRRSNARKNAPQQVNAPASVHTPTETILTQEYKYFSKNPIYNIQFEYQPLISIIIPVFNTPAIVLGEMIISALNQTYTNLELCIINSSPENSEVVDCINKYRQKDKRIVVKNIQNKGIAENTNVGVKIANGEFVAFLDHDDILAPHALFEVVSRLQEDRLAYDFFYSDKDMMPEDGRTVCNPLYKPMWSPEIMYSANYLTHFCIIRKELIEKAGNLDSETDGAQDWDIYLKVSRLTDKICHISQKLYHWRIIQTSVASGIGAKPYALIAQIKSLTNHLKALNYNATVKFQNEEKSILKLIWNDTNVKKVTFIIIDNSNEIDAKSLVNSIKEYKDLSGHETEIMLLTGNKIKNSDITSVYNKTGNLYEDLNKIVKDSSGEVLVCFDSEMNFNDANSISELVTWAAQPQYGYIAPKIINKQDNILSAGLVINGNFILDMFKGVANHGYTILGHTEWYRNITGVRLECFSIKTALLKANPFNTEFGVYSCIESSLRLSNSGLRHVYNPFAVLTTNELEDFHTTNVNTPSFKKLKADYNISAVDRHWNENLETNNSIPTENKRKLISLTPTVSNSQPVLTGWEKYSSDAMYLAQAYDFSSDDFEKNFKLQHANEGFLDVKTVNWLLPDFDFIYYAGLYTIFRFANFLRTQKNVKNNFIILGNPDVSNTYKMIIEAFPALNDSKVIGISKVSEIDKLPYADASICSLWTTAYYLLRFNNTKRKFYFIQDYEPLFYPAGSTFGQSETTYKFGFYGITNTLGLRKIYENNFNGKAIDLKPCVDHKIFYPRKTGHHSGNTFKVFFYGRPGHPRNGFELGAAVLRTLKSKFKERIEIYCAGSEWNPADYYLDGVVTNLGRMDFEKTGDLYRACDVGLVMMFTKHPSYLPFELMACKCAVVSNHNPDTTWFLKNGENCILTDASATRIAEAIEKLLLNEELRNTITENAWKDISENHANWEDELNKLYDFVCTLNN